MLPDRGQLRVMLVAIGLGVIFTFGLWLPQHRRERALDNEILTLENALAADVVEPAEIKAYTGRLASLRDELAAAERPIPREQALGPLLRDLNRELQQRAVHEQEIEGQGVQHGKSFSVLPVVLRFRGPFPAVYGFLREVESMPRLIKTTRLTLDAVNDEAPEMLRVRIELSAVFEPQEAQP